METNSELLGGTGAAAHLPRMGRLHENLARYEGLDLIALSGVSGKRCLPYSSKEV